MKQDIVLAGVGGQGILTIAAIMAKAVLAEGLRIKQSEVHGMAQRGGAVLAHLRISDQPVFSDLVPKGRADVVLALEPLEAIRQAPFLSPEGSLISARTPLVNIPDYPNLDTLLARLLRAPNALLLDALSLARQAGSSRGANMVMLGALAARLDMSAPAIRHAVEEYWQRKGDEVVAGNLRAFDAGFDAGKI